jgi:hypothetical protein
MQAAEVEDTIKRIASHKGDAISTNETRQDQRAFLIKNASNFNAVQEWKASLYAITKALL